MLISRGLSHNLVIGFSNKVCNSNDVKSHVELELYAEVNNVSSDVVDFKFYRSIKGFISRVVRAICHD